MAYEDRPIDPREHGVDWTGAKSMRGKMKFPTLPPRRDGVSKKNYIVKALAVLFKFEKKLVLFFE